MPSSALFQLMGLPVPPPITTITSNNNQEEGDDDTISILPSQSYDNVIIDLSKASFTEIESKLDSCVAVWGDGSTTNTIGGPSGNASGTASGTGTGTASIAGGIDISRVNSGTSTIEEEDDDDKSNHDGIANDNIHDDHDDGSLNLDESDLSPLLEILLRGKNDDYDEDAMNQSMSIYRKLLRPLPPSSSVPSSLSWSWSCAHSVSAAATAGSSFKSGITSPSPLPMPMPQPPRLFIHEGTLVYAVRKKYTDVYMMELMNLLLDAMEENNRYYYNTATNSNNNNNNNPSRNTIDGGRILNLALIYGNVGASRVIVKRFPETLSTRDYLRGQLPLHVACHIGMMVEDEDDEDFDEDGFSITTGATGATGRSSVIRRKRRKYRQAELIELLVTEGVRHNVGGANGAGGLYEQDDSGTTPLMQLIHALNNPFTWDDVDEEENHMDNHNSNNNYAQEQQQQQDEKIVNFDMDEETLANTNVAITNKPNAKRRPLANLEICIRAAWNARGPNNHFPILHEAMNISSPDAFYRILEIVKYYDNDLSGLDRRGRTALVKAIYMDKIIQRRTSTKDIIKMILGGVSSKCATLTDGAGRLPLHIAAEMGLLWNEGLGDIVYAHYRALEEPHSVSGFYPFILAAQAGTGSKDLDTIYRLVRERPKLIIRAKRKGRPRVKIPPEFLVNFSEAKRPLTPSVHRPLLHIPAVDRIASDGGSERTKSTINSSEGVAVDPETSIRFQNDEKSSNLFDK